MDTPNWPDAPSHPGSSTESSVSCWVAAFADAWRAPRDADSFVDDCQSLLHADYRFNLPLVNRQAVGLTAFRDRFARPLFDILSDIRGTVESWTAIGDIVFIELHVTGTVGGRSVLLRVCDQVTLADGLALERFSYVNPLPPLSAVLRAPRLWPRIARWHLTELKHQRGQHQP